MEKENYIVTVKISNADNMSAKPVAFAFDCYSEKDIYSFYKELAAAMTKAIEEKGFTS